MGRSGRGRAGHRHRRHPRPASDALRISPPEAAHVAGGRPRPSPLRLPAPRARHRAVGSDRRPRCPRRGARHDGPTRPLRRDRRQRPAPPRQRGRHRPGPRRRARPGPLRRSGADGRPPRHPGQPQAGGRHRRGLPVPRDARRGAPQRQRAVPRRGDPRAGSVADRRRVLGLQPLEPRQRGRRGAHRPRPRLRHGLGQHARNRVLGRRVRRVQPRADGRRLRHDRDRGRPGLGARRSGRHGRPVVLGHHAALHRGHEPPAPRRRGRPVRDRRPVAAGVARRDLQLRFHPAVDQGAQRGRLAGRFELGHPPHRRR